MIIKLIDCFLRVYFCFYIHVQYLQGSRICSNEKGYIIHELKHIITVVSRLHFVSGLLWSSGSMWKEQRTFALTTMRKFGFGKRCLQGQIMEEVDCLMEELEKYGNKPFDIQNILNTSVSNVICSLLFGKRFDYEDAKFKHLIILLNKLLSTSSSSSPAFIFPILRHLTKSRFIKVQNIFADIDEFTSEIIVEHKRNFDGNNVRDFIDGFLLEQKQAEENTTFTGNF